jgi:hypothetical protein
VGTIVSLYEVFVYNTSELKLITTQVKPRSYNVFVQNMTCHGGNGPAIGSLGQYLEDSSVIGVLIKDVHVSTPVPLLLMPWTYKILQNKAPPPQQRPPQHRPNKNLDRRPYTPIFIRVRRSPSGRWMGRSSKHPLRKLLCRRHQRRAGYQRRLWN